MPRMPLMEYEEPAESVLTEDTCVTEPVDTVQRERAVRARQEREQRQRAQTQALNLQGAGCDCPASTRKCRDREEGVCRSSGHTWVRRAPLGPSAQVLFCWED